MGFPGGSVVKNLPDNAGDTGSVPGLGRSPAGWNGNPLQYSFLENPMGSRAWQATVHRVAKIWTQLSHWAHTHTHTHILGLHMCSKPLLHSQGTPPPSTHKSGEPFNLSWLSISSYNYIERYLTIKQLNSLHFLKLCFQYAPKNTMHITNKNSLWC